MNSLVVFFAFIIGENRMKQYGSIPILPSEITPEEHYLNRRQFMIAAGTLSAAALLAACMPNAPETAGLNATATTIGAPTQTSDPRETDMTSYKDVTNFNNYYEFTTDKTGVARLAEGYPATKPWTVEVGGLVNKPRTYDVDELIKGYDQEERIYRLRCVEAWSMVIPWTGFPLHKLLKDVEPMSSAKYIRFETIFDPDHMEGQSAPTYPWPYTEGLRLDEAMHDLTLMVTGLYGKALPGQNGAPLRLAVPWKYGFKSIKAIVKIDLVEEQPATLWSTIAPNEYGFYSNVNPTVPHPRWSQNLERRIGQSGRIATHMFNGYSDQVTSLYADMDLAKYY
jgi:sulfoxide reductase catalytic subunit YedY